MTQIVVDSLLAGRLHDLSQTVELCDQAGCVLGRFVPSADARQFEPVTPDVTESDLEKRKGSNDWYTTDEVLKQLENL